MTENRPYMFELAALVAEGQDHENVRNTAVANGVRGECFDRAVEVVRLLQRGGEDLQDFVLREYILDGWLQGYLPLDIPADSPMLTTWQLGQLSTAHYATQR